MSATDHDRPAPPQMTRRSAISRAQRAPAYDEVGVTGLRHYGGYVVEEWLARLVGPRGAKAYREMSDNDPVVGSVLFAIEMLARGVRWTVQPGGDARADELVESCMDDMSHTWADFISEAFSILPYGWAFHEIVYKRRQGPDAEVGSRYDDGMIGWRKLPIRAQETLDSWEFAEDDGLVAMNQMAFDGSRRTIPIEKALLFRTTTKRGNPEGRSVLRSAFVPWYRKKNIEEIEAIGTERDLAGLPTIAPPEGVDLTLETNAHLMAAAQDLVSTIRRDEDEGVVLPSSGWKLELLTTGGSRQIDTDKVVRRYDQRIATTVLADFILLAQDKVGSYALGSQKIDTFEKAMQAWLGSIAEVLNRYAIPRLLRLNGLSVVEPPKLVPGDVGEADLSVAGEFLGKLHEAGAPIDWTPDLMGALFKLAGLPEPEDGETRELSIDQLVAAANADLIKPDSRLEALLRSKANLPEAESEERPAVTPPTEDEPPEPESEEDADGPTD